MRGGEEEGGGGLALTSAADAFSAASHKTSTLRSPAFASAMIFAAIISSVRQTRSDARRPARAISNARPMRRVVSESKLWPFRKGRMAMARSPSVTGRERDWSLGHRRLAQSPLVTLLRRSGATSPSCRTTLLAACASCRTSLRAACAPLLTPLCAAGAPPLTPLGAGRWTTRCRGLCATRSRARCAGWRGDRLGLSI
jgi:hypothetical protein